MTQIKVYIPSVFRHSKAVNDFIDTMLKEFNGLTVYDCLGYWINPENQIETETVKIYEMVSNNEDIAEIYAIVSHEALKLKELLKQQTVLFTINNKPYFL